MNIGFDNDDIEKRCINPMKFSGDYGKPVCKKIERAITILVSAANLYQFKNIWQSAHWLEGERHWEVAINLVGKWRLICEPVKKESREWQKVEDIVIKEVSNHYK